MIAMLVPGLFLVVNALDRERERDGARAARDGVCSGLVDRLVSALDAFTGQFDGISAVGLERIPPMPSMEQLRSEAAGFDQELSGADCEIDEARDAVERWRRTETANGPLAQAVRGAMAANVLGVLGETDNRYDSDSGRRGPGDGGLPLPTGATLTLPAGRFRVGRTLALIQDLTIQGAGQGRTVVTTSADGAGLVLTSQVAFGCAGCGWSTEVQVRRRCCSCAPGLRSSTTWQSPAPPARRRWRQDHERSSQEEAGSCSPAQTGSRCATPRRRAMRWRGSSSRQGPPGCAPAPSRQRRVRSVLPGQRDRTSVRQSRVGERRGGDARRAQRARSAPTTRSSRTRRPGSSSRGDRARGCAAT